jgi:tetratricopeptide repeat protein 30
MNLTALAHSFPHMKHRYYAKRCFLALAENMAKHLVTLKDTSLHEVLEFLDIAELHGNKIKAFSTTATLGSRDGAARRRKQTTFSGGASAGGTHNTISYEARQLKFLFIKLME